MAKKKEQQQVNLQLQELIENAPPDGVTPNVMKEAIAPILRVFAERLQHLEYYILQTLDQGWVLTTLSNRARPEQEKKVIYAFPTQKDAMSFQGTENPEVTAIAIPVTHILFQMFALHQVDSTVFMETPGDLTTGREVQRNDLQQLVQKQLQALGFVPKGNIPPNIA